MCGLVAGNMISLYLPLKLVFMCCRHRRRFIPLRSDGGFFCGLVGIEEIKIRGGVFAAGVKKI